LTSDASLHPIGVIRSPLKTRAEAPLQGREGGPDAWIELSPAVLAGIEGMEAGQEIIVLTWLHEARREVLKVRPRGKPSNPLSGVFSTRSPDRPNPIGLHRVRILEVAGERIKVGPLEAIDGTPVVDLKPVLKLDDH
jgi:tRNA-Thr(GGU) m(6)t(6)A37 methyltransferase TsaA